MLLARRSAPRVKGTGFAREATQQQYMWSRATYQGNANRGKGRAKFDHYQGNTPLVAIVMLELEKILEGQ